MDVRQTCEFADWMANLRDISAAKRIAQRIVRLQSGLLGDVKFLGKIGKLRVDHGPAIESIFCNVEVNL